MSTGFSPSSNPSPSGRALRGFPRLQRQAREDAPADQTGDGAEAPQHGQPAVVGDGFRLIFDTANQRPVFVVVNFLGWAGSIRQAFFHALADFHQPYNIRVEGGVAEFADPFEFVLAQMVGPDDAERCQAGRQAAVEAAAVLLPHDIEVACNRILARLQELGIPDERPEDLQDEVIGLLDGVPDEVVGEQPVRVQDYLPTAPVTATSVVPDGWTFSADGVALGATLVLYAALVIVRRLIGDDGAEMLELAYFRNAAWHHREVAREQIATTQRIIGLARTGLPVTAVNARNVVRYLADYERDNLGSIPTVRITQRTGWHTIDGQQVFVLGNRVVVETPPSADQENRQQQPEIVRFRAGGDGPAQIAAGLCTAGTLAGWLETVTPIGPYPRARFAFYAAQVPPLLRILDIPNFVVDFCGPTSRGKTTALRLVASAWGNPDETTGHPLIINWNSTPAYRLGVAAALADIPLVIDETRLAGSRNEIEQTTYAFVNGRTRGRTGTNGTTAGLSSVLITSGEEPVVAMTKKGGTRARCFSLWGSPFGATTTQTAGVVRQLNQGLAANYGHAGLAFVQFLADRPGCWEM